MRTFALEPEVQVGAVVDASGFPLMADVHTGFDIPHPGRKIRLKRIKRFAVEHGRERQTFHAFKTSGKYGWGKP